MNKPLPTDSRRIAVLLDGLAARAAAALVWENLWPRLVALASVGGFFLTVSWLGLWIHLPLWGRIFGLVLFAVGAIILLFPLLKFKIPGRGAALARIDRDSGLPHNPASALDDVLANGQTDTQTRALWSLHMRRAELTAPSLRVAMPSQGSDRRRRR